MQGQNYGGGIDQSQKGDWKQPRENVSKNDLRTQLDQFDDFVIVGTVKGQPAIAMSGSQQQARTLLKTHAQDFLPQTA